MADVPGRLESAAWLRWALIAAAAAGALRAPALTHDFWFDEAWSATMVQTISGPLQVFSKLATDNNHPLNSWFLLTLGDGLAFPWYRLPSFAAGLAVVLLAGALLRSCGNAASIIAVFWMAVSYPLAVYSTEARGYASMLCFGLAATVALQSWFNRPTRWSFFTYQLAIVLGLLSHLTFGFFAVGLVTLTCAHGLAGIVSLRDRLRAPLLLNAAPLGIGVGMWVGFYRRMAVAGGDPMPVSALLADIATMLWGAWPIGWLTATAWVAGAIAWIAGWRWLRQKRPAWLAAYVVSMLVAPFGLLLLQPIFDEQTVVFPRYLLVPVISTSLVCALGLAYIRMHKPHGGLASMALIAVILGGHLWQDVLFTIGGRGGYLKAAQLMTAGANGNLVEVTGNSDFRTPILLNFYQARIPGSGFDYCAASQDCSDRALWFIWESLQSGTAPTPKTIQGPLGRIYSRAADYPYYGLSGSRWTLYRKADEGQKP